MMKSASLLLSILLLASVSAAAQAPVAPPQGYGVATITTIGPNSQRSTVPVPMPAVPACPVSMQAKQAGMTDLVKVQKGRNASPETLSKPGQRIRLFLQDPHKGGKIASATVTARGLSARSRMFNAETGSPTSDMRRTLQVTFVEENGGFAAELILPGFTSVQSIGLDALTYVDGSTWKMADHQFCTVAPDPFMLVAGR